MCPTQRNFIFNFKIVTGKFIYGSRENHGEDPLDMLRNLEKNDHLAYLDPGSSVACSLDC